MKAKLVEFTCIKRLEGCLQHWKEASVEEPPYYDICKVCYEQLCQDEREATSDLD